MTKALKKRMLEQIRKNIETNGFHIYEKQPPSSIREVSMGTFLGIDTSLEFITSMKVEDGYWRNRRETEWQDWR